MGNSASTISDYSAAYVKYLNASPTSFHAADQGARQLRRHGFTEIQETAPWPNLPGNYYLIREGALVAWVIPHDLAKGAGFSIFGCHTDSPAFKLKPTVQSTTADGWGQLCVEVYGGMLFNSWLDRELEVAGIVYDHLGRNHLIQTGPIARIPQLAIHLDRGVNEGLTLNPQQHLQPVWTVDNPDLQLLDLIATNAGLDESKQISAFELFLSPTQSASFFGDKLQFVAAGRQDNLSSVFAGLQAIITASTDPCRDHVSVMAAFDHEEVGSNSRTGAAGPLLEDTLRRTTSALGKDLEGTAQMLAASTCISADAGHSVHPNYGDRHDPETRPVLGRGPLLKLNANQRYASSGPGISLWNRVCLAAKVPNQSFVSNNALPCGSTIGPITATRLGIPTVDIGIGLLSMHSAREMSHIDDLHGLYRAATQYFAGGY